MDDARELARWADRFVKATPVKAARAATERAGSTFERTRAQAAALVAALHRAERCEDCGLQLEDATSIERKVGRDCWAKRQAVAS